MRMILNFSLSLSALNFSLNITHPENTTADLFNWMSSNFLFLNPAKTEFLIYGLPQQLSKINNPTIYLLNNIIFSYVDSARNLGNIFNKNHHLHNVSLPLLFLNHAFTTFVTKDVFVIILIKILPAVLILLSFTLKMIIVNLFYSICLHLKRIVFNLSWTLLLSTKLLNFITLLSPLVLQLQTDLYIIMLVFCGTVSHLI